MSDSSPRPSRTLFETERLRCRELRPSDQAAMVAVYSDPLVARFVDDGTPISREDCARWMVVTANNQHTRGYGMSVLESRDTGEVVGFIGLVHPGGQPEPEVKYAFRPSVWGRGYATEAVVAMLAHGHRVHGMTRIQATVDVAHAASQQVLAKAGAVRVDDIVEDDGSLTALFVWTAG